MPLFSFDVEGSRATKDESGIELAGMEAAREHSMLLLRAALRAELPDGDQLNVHVIVRDEQRSVIYVATLAVAGVWTVALPGNAKP